MGRKYSVRRRQGGKFFEDKADRRTLLPYVAPEIGAVRGTPSGVFALRLLLDDFVSAIDPSALNVRISDEHGSQLVAALVAPFRQLLSLAR